MIRNILGAMKDAGLYPAISLVLFVAIFAGVLIWVNRMTNHHIKEMSNLPLDKDESHE